MLKKCKILTILPSKKKCLKMFLVMFHIVIFIQKRPQGMFALKGRAMDS